MVLYREGVHLHRRQASFGTTSALLNCTSGAWCERRPLCGRRLPPSRRHPIEPAVGRVSGGGRAGIWTGTGDRRGGERGGAGGAAVCSGLSRRRAADLELPERGGERGGRSISTEIFPVTTPPRVVCCRQKRWPAYRPAGRSKHFPHHPTHCLFVGTLQDDSINSCWACCRPKTAPTVYVYIVTIVLLRAFAHRYAGSVSWRSFPRLQKNRISPSLYIEAVMATDTHTVSVIVDNLGR